MKKLPVALLSLGLLAGCSSSKTDTQPDETVQEDTTEVAPEVVATPDANIIDAYAKYSAGDVDGTVAHFAEGATWHEVGGPTAPAADMLAGFKTSMSDMKVAPRRIFVAPEAGITVTQGIFQGTHDGPLADGTPATNKPVANDYVHIQWWNDEGQITKTLSMSNGTTIPKMTGLMPVPKGMPQPATSEWPTGAPAVIAASDNQANLDLVKAQVEAAVAGDFDTYAANMADDYSGAAFGEYSLDGTKESAVAWLKGMHKAFTEPSLENVHAWSFGDFVVTVDKVTMKHTGAMGPMKPTNKTVTMHFVTIDEVADGKIVHGEQYSNPMELMMQLAPPKEDGTAMAN